MHYRCAQFFTLLDVNNDDVMSKSELSELFDAAFAVRRPRAPAAFTSCVYELSLEACVLYARERRRGRSRSRASERASKRE